jgi:hypothetical protein
MSRKAQAVVVPVAAALLLSLTTGSSVRAQQPGIGVGPVGPVAPPVGGVNVGVDVNVGLGAIGGVSALPVGPSYFAPPPGPNYQPLSRFYYYPYYYFPHSYWPTNSPKWPEPHGKPYQRPPAYMAYPPFREPHWRYEYWQPQNYYRGFHFWLDQF